MSTAPFNPNILAAAALQAHAPAPAVVGGSPVVAVPATLAEEAQALGVNPLMLGNSQLNNTWKDFSGGTSDRESGSAISSLSPARLSQLFGSSAEEIQNLDTDHSMTVGQARSLASNPETLSTIKELRAQRPDLSVSDLTGKGGGLSPLLKDPDVREALKQRPDLKLKDIQDMQNEIRDTFKNPRDAKQAMKQALGALGDGGDVKPKELSEIMTAMTKLFDPKDQSAGSNSLTMFEKARELLKSGKKPDDIMNLIKATKATASGDKVPATSIMNTFDTACKTLESRPDMSSKQLLEMANVMAEKFPGKDPSDRTQAFAMGAKMLSESPTLDAKGLGAMLQRGADQGLKGQKLLNSFETQAQALKEGAVNPAALLDHTNKSFHFNKDGTLAREQTSSAARSEHKIETLGRAETKPSADTGVASHPATGRGTPGTGRETASPAGRDAAPAPAPVAAPASPGSFGGRG